MQQVKSPTAGMRNAEVAAMSYEECARKIVEANDLLRTTCIGAELEISNSVAALPPKLIAEALFKMRTFDEFNSPGRQCGAPRP